MHPTNIQHRTPNVQHSIRRPASSRAPLDVERSMLNVNSFLILPPIRVSVPPSMDAGTASPLPPNSGTTLAKLRILMPWIYLLIASVLEVVWAIGLKYTNGF